MLHIKPIFAHFSHAPSKASDAYMVEIEKYVMLLYQHTSHLSHVNDARKQLFAFGNHDIKNILPSQDALE